MNAEFEKIEQLLNKGSFESLSEEDQYWVKENLGGAEAYDHLRESTIIARQEKAIPVSSGVKKDLMKQFKEKHQPGWKLVLQWKIPAYAALILLIAVSSSLITFLPEKERLVEKYVWQDPVVDTVFVASEPDTVFIERTIERPVYVKVYETSEETPVVAVERKSKGKSLADQSEIKDILVSGR